MSKSLQQQKWCDRWRDDDDIPWPQSFPSNSQVDPSFVDDNVNPVATEAQLIELAEYFPDAGLLFDHFSSIFNDDEPSAKFAKTHHEQ